MRSPDSTPQWHIPLAPTTKQSWILKSSYAIADFVDMFNTTIARTFPNGTPILLDTADFKRLYTNIDLADLKSTLKALVAPFFCCKE